jgi:hypothetical protein
MHKKAHHKEPEMKKESMPMHKHKIKHKKKEEKHKK